MTDQKDFQNQELDGTPLEGNSIQQLQTQNISSCDDIQIAQILNQDQDSQVLDKDIQRQSDVFKEDLCQMNAPNPIFSQDGKIIKSDEIGDIQIQEKVELIEKNFLNFCQSLQNKSVSIPITFLKEQIDFDFDFPTQQQILKIHKNLRNKETDEPFKILKNWKLNETKVLVWVVTNICVVKKYDLRTIPEEEWPYVSSLFWQKDAFSCKSKWFQLQKMTVYQVPWTKEEEEKLSELVLRYHQSNLSNLWSKVADDLNKELNLSFHRSGKKCRDRWLNKLNPELSKTQWKDEDELELLKLVLQNGKRWALISKQLKVCRSQNDVKNHFYSLLRKGEKFQNEMPSSVDLDKQQEQISKISHDDLNQYELAIISASIEKISWRLKNFKGESVFSQKGGHQQMNGFHSNKDLEQLDGHGSQEMNGEERVQQIDGQQYRDGLQQKVEPQMDGIQKLKQMNGHRRDGFLQMDENYRDGIHQIDGQNQRDGLQQIDGHQKNGQLLDGHQREVVQQKDGKHSKTKPFNVPFQVKQEFNPKQDLQQFNSKSHRKLQQKEAPNQAQDITIDGELLNKIPLNINGNSLESQMKQEVIQGDKPSQDKFALEPEGRYFKCQDYVQIKLAEIHQLQPCLMNQHTQTIFQLSQQQLIEYVNYIQQTMVPQFYIQATIIFSIRSQLIIYTLQRVLLNEQFLEYK